MNVCVCVYVFVWVYTVMFSISLEKTHFPSHVLPLVFGQLLTLQLSGFGTGWNWAMYHISLKMSLAQSFKQCQVVLYSSTISPIQQNLKKTMFKFSGSVVNGTIHIWTKKIIFKHLQLDPRRRGTRFFPPVSHFLVSEFKTVFSDAKEHGLDLSGT